MHLLEYYSTDWQRKTELLKAVTTRNNNISDIVGLYANGVEADFLIDEIHNNLLHRAVHTVKAVVVLYGNLNLHIQSNRNNAKPIDMVDRSSERGNSIWQILHALDDPKSLEYMFNDRFLHLRQKYARGPLYEINVENMKRSNALKETRPVLLALNGGGIRGITEIRELLDHLHPLNIT